jgi:hypothetical protein
MMDGLIAKNKNPIRLTKADRVMSVRFGKKLLPLAALITRPQSESQIGAGKTS